MRVAFNNLSRRHHAHPNEIASVSIEKNQADIGAHLVLTARKYTRFLAEHRLHSFGNRYGRFGDFIPLQVLLPRFDVAPVIFPGLFLECQGR